MSPILSMSKKTNGKHLKEMNIENSYKNKMRYNKNDFKLNNNMEINLDKYKLYKKDKYSGYC